MNTVTKAAMSDWTQGLHTECGVMRVKNTYICVHASIFLAYGVHIYQPQKWQTGVDNVVDRVQLSMGEI